MGLRRSRRYLPFTFALLVVAIVSATAIGRAASVTVASKPLTPTQTCTLSATAAASTVAIDTLVNQSSPTANSGTTNSTEVRSSNNANRRVYIRFDLTTCNPALPATATITKSTLRLFATAIPGACRTHNIYRATASWAETTITWNNQPFGTAINNPTSGQTGSITVGTAPCQNTINNIYVTGWDVTSDVQGFVSGNVTNYGWMVRDSVEGSATSRAVIYSSKEAANIPRSPQLIINYRLGS